MKRAKLRDDATNSTPARTLTVTVHEARGLPALDEYASNPYVSLLVGASQKRETKARATRVERRVGPGLRLSTSTMPSRRGRA